jgi:carboxylate-amine ligase
LFTVAGELGIALGSTGTHALSDYRRQRIIDTPHYRRRQEGLQWVARRNNTFSIHVHVGIRGADRAVAACDRLRPVLPLLLAVSASSPFIDGTDAGLHSGRTQTFTRTFPRCGIPDAYGSWDAWADYCALLVQTRSITEFTQIWWSVRPHHDFGTLEVRICDAQPTASENEALATLVVACVRRALEEIDAGETPPDLPPRLIEENLWRAIRYGQDGRLLDLEAPRIEEFDAAETAERLAAWAGIELPAFPVLNSAQRQRRMLDDGASPFEVFAATVAETRARVPAIMGDT